MTNCYIFPKWNMRRTPRNTMVLKTQCSSRRQIFLPQQGCSPPPLASLVFPIELSSSSHPWHSSSAPPTPRLSWSPSQPPWRRPRAGRTRRQGAALGTSWPVRRLSEQDDGGRRRSRKQGIRPPRGCLPWWSLTQLASPLLKLCILELLKLCIFELLKLCIFELLKLCFFELACELVLLWHLLAGQAQWWKLISLSCCWEIKKQRVEHPTQSFKQRWVPLTKQPLLIRQLSPQEVKWVLCKVRHDRVLSRSDVVQTNVSHLLGMKVRQEEQDDCWALFKIHSNWPHQPTSQPTVVFSISHKLATTDNSISGNWSQIL